MDTKVKINYTELETQLNKIVAKINEETTLRENIGNVVNNTDAWNSKYAKEFKNHINQEFLPWLKKLVWYYATQINDLEKIISDYKKMDRL